MHFAFSTKLGRPRLANLLEVWIGALLRREDWLEVYIGPVVAATCFELPCAEFRSKRVTRHMDQYASPIQSLHLASVCS